MSRLPSGLSILCLCLSFLGFGSVAHAQTASTTEGAIVGTVTDKANSALPGATVSLSGSEVMGVNTTKTDEKGFYHFAALLPGDYAIKYQASGFGEEVREGVHVSLGFTATVDVQMAVGSLTQTVTVEAQTSAIDLQSNDITSDFEDTQLKTLPGSRDLWAVLSQAPAIAETKMDVGGSDALTQQGYTVYGMGGAGGGGINRGEVEGMMVNEGSGGGGSEMFYVDYGAMQTISVNAANNTTEMPEPGVLSQMVMKSGGNDFHGSVYFDYEDGALEWHNINPAQIAALTSGGVVGTTAVPLNDVNRLNLFTDVSANVGGYVIKNKLWWFFAYRDTTTEQNYPTLNVTQKSWSPNYSGKMTYNLTPKQRLIGFYTHSNKSQPDYLDALILSGGRQAGALETESTAWNSVYPVYVWDGEYIYDITSSLVFEAQGGQYFSGWNRQGKSDLSRIEDVSSDYVSGGLNNTENDRHRPQGRASLSYIHSGWWGTHDIKVGSEYMRDTNFVPWGGLGIPGSLEPTVPCPTAAAIAALGTTCQTVSTLINGAPDDVYFYAVGPYEANNGNSTFGLYVNDTWQINKRLTVNAGLRFDRQGIFSQNETGPNGTTFSANNYVDFHNFGPRVGVSYDLSGRGTSVIKASFGHYFNYPAADYGSSINPDVAGWRYEYLWKPTALQLGTRAGDTPTDFYEPGDTLGSLQGTTGGAATTSFAPNLKLANTYQASAYFEQQFGGLTLRSGLVYNEVVDIAGTVNVDRPLSAYSNRVTYYIPNSSNTISNSSPTVTIWDVPSTFNTNAVLNEYENLPEDAHYYNWEITAIRPNVHGRWSLMGSFNYTWARPSSLGTGTSFTPNQLINTNGCTVAQDTTAPCTGGNEAFYNFQGKINSTIKMPWGIKLTPIFRLQSGTPYAPTFSTSGTKLKAPGTTISEPTNLVLSYTILAAPYGSDRTPTIALLDVRTEKVFTFKERYAATGFFDVYNITNTNVVTALTAASGSAFGLPSNITPPRVMRLGVKFDF